MRSYIELTLQLQYVLSGCAFLAVMSQFALCLYRYLCTGKLRACIREVLLLCILLLLLSVLPVVTKSSRQVYPVRVPWISILLLSAAIFVRAAVFMVWQYRQNRKTLSPDSIKEALDDLNCGLCFADPIGRVILINYTMGSLIAEVSGSYPQTLGELKDALKDPAVIMDTGMMSSEKDLYRFSDGKVWRFKTRALEGNGLDGFTQTTAWDVTRLYETNEQLQSENEQLARTNEEIQMMLERLSHRIREKEILQLKMRIHNDIGTSLISIANMIGAQSGEDMEKQILLLQDAVSYFSNQPHSARQTFEEVRRKAEEMHVELILNGQEPSDPVSRELFALAVFECVTNCVNHAKGDKVFIKVEEADKGCLVTITDNGKGPEKSIREGGGLSALRRRVEDAGGTIDYSYSPQLIVTLHLVSSADNRALPGLSGEAFDNEYFVHAYNI